MISSITLNDDRSEKVRYNTPDYPVYARRGLLSQYPEYKAPNHWHDDTEFIRILSGQMRYNVNGVILDLKEGDGVFVNSGQMHFGFSDSEQECDFLCIILHPMLLASVFPFEHDFVMPLIRNRKLPFLHLSRETGWHREILSQLDLLYQSRDQRTAPMCALSCFARIWTLLCEHAPEDNGKQNRQGQDLMIVKNMVGFIQKNYRDKISLAEIAASGTVGQSKCCKLFARYFSQSPNEYLNHYRIDKSLDLLRNTDLSVTETALSVGFSNASYYAEVFRRYLGKSPREFRNSFRNSLVLAGAHTLPDC